MQLSLAPGDIGRNRNGPPLAAAEMIGFDESSERESFVTLPETNSKFAPENG